MKTQLPPKNIELRRISIFLIGLGLFMISMLLLIIKDVKVMRLEVDLKELPVKTAQSIQLAGNELIYGTRGILKYHPQSFGEIVMYNEFLSVARHRQYWTQFFRYLPASISSGSPGPVLKPFFLMKGPIKNSGG